MQTARQLECFNPRSSHFRHEIRFPIQPWTYAELDLHWRRWIQLEVRRRTTYFIFVFDVLATLETSIPCICSPAEVCYVPLPAPASLWCAGRGEQWLSAARVFTPVSLDQVLRVLFTSDANPSTAIPSRPISRSLDRFAMHVVILTLLRGVIEIGEGRRERGDWYDLTDLWLDRSEAEEWISRSLDGSGDRAAVLALYGSALRTVSQTAVQSCWRIVEVADNHIVAEMVGCSTLPTFGEHSTVRADLMRGRVYAVCSYFQTDESDALPIYRLVESLMGVIASSAPSDVRRAFVTRINFAEMLNTARTIPRAA